MIRLFRWLIWGDGHLHKWEIFEKTVVVGAQHLTREEAEKAVSIGSRFILRCSTCGNMKRFENLS